MIVMMMAMITIMVLINMKMTMMTNDDDDDADAGGHDDKSFQPIGQVVPEHVLRKIHHYTFRPKYFLDDLYIQNPVTNFHFIPQIFFSKLSTTSPYFTFQLLSQRCLPFIRFFFHDSSLQKQPFITAHFRSSLHIFVHHCTFSFITAHFVHDCTLKQALSRSTFQRSGTLP